MESRDGYPDFDPPPYEVRQPEIRQPEIRQPEIRQHGPQPAPDQAAPPRPPHRPRRRRGRLVLAVALVALLALLVAADRIAPVIVGNRIASMLQSAMNTDQRPVVRFEGFPFLTQVATGHYQRISMTANDVPVPGTAGQLSILQLGGTLTDVRADLGYHTLTIGDFTGSATVSYQSFSAFLGTNVSYDGGAAGGGGGYVKLSLGSSIVVTGRPAINPSTGEMSLRQPEFRIGGHLLPASMTSDLADNLFRTKLPELLPGIAPVAIRADRRGLTLTGEGRHLVIRA